MKKLFFPILLLSILMVSNASAVTFTASHHMSEADALVALDAWLEGSGSMILEDFEGFAPHLPGDGGVVSYPSFDSSVFSASGDAGSGAMSFDKTAPKIGAMAKNSVGTNNYGRTRYWESASMFGNQYLDSGDVTSLTLTFGDNIYDNLFFFLYA